MPLNFPNSPLVNDVFTFNNRTWIYNGDGWAINTVPSVGTTAPVFPTGNYGTEEAFVGEVSIKDAFGVLIIPFFDCMDPAGQPISASTSVDLGLIT